VLIPEEIKIGGFLIGIELVEHLVNERGNLGEYHPRTQTIKLDKDNTKQQNQETLIHEILEAVTSIYDIEMQHKDLSNMAVVLHQILLDNEGLSK